MCTHWKQPPCFLLTPAQDVAMFRPLDHFRLYWRTTCRSFVYHGTGHGTEYFWRCHPGGGGYNNFTTSVTPHLEIPVFGKKIHSKFRFTSNLESWCLFFPKLSMIRKIRSYVGPNWIWRTWGTSNVCGNYPKIEVVQLTRIQNLPRWPRWLTSSMDWMGVRFSKSELIGFTKTIASQFSRRTYTLEQLPAYAKRPQRSVTFHNEFAGEQFDTKWIQSDMSSLEHDAKAPNAVRGC